MFNEGDRLGRYVIGAKLGAGGMGEVYLAQDTKLDRKVALKILPADVASDQTRMRRFVREAKAVSSLNHPNILTIHEIGEGENTHFIATELVDGETLRARLMRQSLALDEVFDIAQQTAIALTAAHAAGIVHRDLKPENIMLRKDGIVKVLDFGLAKLIEPEADTPLDTTAPTRLHIDTEPGIVLGTALYMSPEQARGLDIDARTDIFSLGVLIYEMVAHRLPFEGSTTSEILASILSDKEPPPLARYSREAPAELERIVTKALRKNRDERYQTVKDLLLDLKSLKQQLDFEAKLERSGHPDVRGALKTAGELGPTTDQPAPSTEELKSIGTQSGSGTVLSGIRHHWLALVLGVLAVTAGIVGFIAYRSPRTNEAPIESIAVLPFTNQNRDPDTEYLSDGLTESIINRLAQLPNLKVIARSSVFRYKDDPLAAGRELGVQVVLTGRVMQRGDNLTISAELVDVRDNKQLWGDQYNRKLSDLLSLQQEIAKEITSTLRLRISGAQQNLVSKNYTTNPDAYQLYLKGRFYWNKRTEESYQKAIEYFQQAIEKDSNYALAYSGLADCYSFLSSQGIRPPHDVFPLAEQAASKAIKIDGSLSEAHTSLAYIKLYYDWDWAGAEQEYNRAIDLNPNYATPHHGYAYLLISSGRTEAAIAEIKKAEEIDPLSLIIQTDHGEFYYFARRPDEAIRQLQKAVDMDPSFVRAHFLLGRALVQKGRCDEAIQEFQKARNLVPEGVEMLGGLAQGYASCGRRAEAQKTMDRLLELSTQHYVSPHWIAAVQAELGNKDEAFKWLDQAFERRFGPLIYLKVNPIWDKLRSDPRFDERLRRVKL